MTITEKKMNLFDIPLPYAYCHCISADIAMGKGIALQFRSMGVKQYILDHHLQRPYTNNWMAETDGYCIATNINDRMIYNLVTKNRYYQKPTLSTLENALQDMKNQMLRDGINQLAMPRIGCGLDKLKWINVAKILQDIFGDTEIEIIVCAL